MVSLKQAAVAASRASGRTRSFKGSVKVPVSREHLNSVFDEPATGLDGAADVGAWLDGIPNDQSPEKLTPAAVLMPLIELAKSMFESPPSPPPDALSGVI